MRSDRTTHFLSCSDCGKLVPRRGHGQKYCPECSQTRDTKRKGTWARDHPRKPSTEELKERWTVTHAARKAAGAQHNEGRSIDWMADPAPDLAWAVRLSIPFDYAISKNHTWTTTKRGHVFLRDEHRRMRDSIIWEFKQALAGQVVKQNRLWIDLLVQKSDHRGDAVNVLDGICDALKVATGLDDRWYSVRRLDWEVCKDSPMIYIGLGQEDVDDAQVCCYCGRLLPYSAFGRNRSRKCGCSRECLECRRVAAKLAKST